MSDPIIPISESTTKVQQSNLPISIKPSAPSRFPINYADNQWDIAAAETALAALAGQTGTFDQHSLNELFARVLWLILHPPVVGDFNNDFNDDFFR